MHYKVILCKTIYNFTALSLNTKEFTVHLLDPICKGRNIRDKHNATIVLIIKINKYLEGQRGKTKVLNNLKSYHEQKTKQKINF